MNPYLHFFIWFLIFLLCIAIWEYAIPGAGIFLGCIIIFALAGSTICYYLDNR